MSTDTPAPAPQRTARGDRTAEAIRMAAVRLFYEHGYEATSLRQIASEVGRTVGSVYNHISSKEDLLYSIMSGIMRDLLDETERIAAAYEDPVARLRAVAELQVAFHAGRAQEVFLGNSELRSLPPVRRAAVVELRDAYERIFREIVEQGVRARAFHVADVRLATYSILAMGSRVADWYRPGGRLTLEQVASGHADFVLRSLTNPVQQVPFGETLALPAG
jgi:TetR/AcrR family transcriptional regulator, cholesterol catabolism regulator